MQLNKEGSEIMIKDIEDFIHKNKIYSKCSDHEKETIDAAMEAVRLRIETLQRELKAMSKLSEENQQLLKRVKSLEERLL